MEISQSGQRSQLVFRLIISVGKLANKLLVKNIQKNVYKKLILSIIIQLTILFLFYILSITAFLKIPSI